MAILFLLIALAGVFVYFKEQQNLREAEWAFAKYIEEVRADGSLDAKSRRERIKAMYAQNGYRLIGADDKKMTVSKKHFSLGAAMIWFGLLGIGLVVYVIYFALKKPQVKTVNYD